MFVEISQLITKASLSGLHLMIRPVGEGKVSVILSTEKSNIAPSDTKLQQALSQNICVEGSVTELDESFISSLLQFGENFNAPSVKTNVSQATASVLGDAPESDLDEQSDLNEQNNNIINDETQTF